MLGIKHINLRGIVVTLCILLLLILVIIERICEELCMFFTIITIKVLGHFKISAVIYCKRMLM